MVKQINPIRKKIIKTELKKGSDAKAAALKAGYTEASANNATALSSVKQCQEEIKRELEARDITADLVIKRLNEDRELARSKGDIASMIKADQLLGSFIALFTDKHQIDQTVISKEEAEILRRYGLG